MRSRDSNFEDAPSRTILHVDLDAFYATVEERENPKLKDLPVVVGADPQAGKGRGVVCAASYAARKFGIHSAMPISVAYRRCPQAVFLEPRMQLYSEVSKRFMAILRRYTDLVEPLSIDEAFLDVTHSADLFGDGEAIARRIQEEIRNEERITGSIGVAPSKFVAKIASDLRKPNGLVLVRPREVVNFLAPLAIQRLWGAGEKAVARFHRLGVKTIGDVLTVPEERLREAFGNASATHFFNLARGIDPRSVDPEHDRKSIGREQTFDRDETDRGEVERILLALTDDVAQSLRRAGERAASVTVKLRTEDFVTISRQASLKIESDTTDELWPIVRALLHKADTTSKPIRLVGVSASLADSNPQLALFDNPIHARSQQVARVVDAVRKKFGNKSIVPAATLKNVSRAPRN